VIRSILYLFLRRVLRLFRSDKRIAAEAELEIAVLRHQVAILRRQVKRPVYRASDKAFLAAASGALRREVWARSSSDRRPSFAGTGSW
jgi:putative transposase